MCKLSDAVPSRWWSLRKVHPQVMAGGVLNSSVSGRRRCGHRLLRLAAYFRRLLQRLAQHRHRKVQACPPCARVCNRYRMPAKVAPSSRVHRSLGHTLHHSATPLKTQHSPKPLPLHLRRSAMNPGMSRPLRGASRHTCMTTPCAVPTHPCM